MTRGLASSDSKRAKWQVKSNVGIAALPKGQGIPSGKLNPSGEMPFPVRELGNTKGIPGAESRICTFPVAGSDWFLSIPFSMRNVIVLAGLGLILASIAIVVRQGWLQRDDPGAPINSAMREALAAKHPQWSHDEAAVLARDFASAHETKSGMRYIIRDPGTGDATPKKGQWVTVHYEGRLFDGTKFDSSYDRGQGPLRVQIGVGRVIAGWDEAIQTMHRGEKRTLAIPYWLAYGERGQGKMIPPKAGLIFHVELIDFQ